ncbi:MAG TPA: ATP-binding cassette domain-containing protein [Actinomycetales bacterium]|nr:ATP-binding cassette domain-containing protein [Actinomycetales bacterium]
MTTDRAPIDDDRRIDIRGLSKRFGAVVAVDDLTFSVSSGRVTGFLGPNGAGKTTTLRMLLGLVHPTAGTATIGGHDYAELADPLRQVGAGLDGSSFHPGRTARDHLHWVCVAGGIPTSRSDEVLSLVGLAEAADRRVGGFSLGMRQRLSLAGALLGDPGVLLLDEPANGLDPEGIAWLRGFLRHLAAEGRTVLISSHVLSEVQQTVDDVVIIARGRLVHTGPLRGLAGEPGTLVRSPDADVLQPALARTGLVVERDADGLVVRGASPQEVGDVAHAVGARLHLLSRTEDDLETAFLRMVSEAERAGEMAQHLPAASPTPVVAGTERSGGAS